jgi:hypothetical protein
MRVVGFFTLPTVITQILDHLRKREKISCPQGADHLRHRVLVEPARVIRSPPPPSSTRASRSSTSSALRTLDELLAETM